MDRDAMVLPDSFNAPVVERPAETVCDCQEKAASLRVPYMERECVTCAAQKVEAAMEQMTTSLEALVRGKR